MVHIHRCVYMFILMSICLVGNTRQSVNIRPNIILIKGIRSAYLPFSSIKDPVFEITNDRLNISVTDIRGNLFQINGISLSNIQNGIYPASAFQTVVIMAHGETYTDDADNDKRSLIEIKCDGSKPGNTIMVGIKTTVQINGTGHRVYATLSGIIPSKKYQSTN